MKRINFNDGWEWWKKGEEKRQAVHLPHDAMLTEKRIPYLKEGAASGYFPGGTYLYEKKIWGDPAWKDKSVMLEFEGVYQKAGVLLNGQKAGGWIYGYTNFYVDLTDRLKWDEENTLQVIADNSQTPNSRWYTGSGIYRPVHLIIGEKHHILPNGIKVVTKSYSPAIVCVTVETSDLRESMEIQVHVRKDGKEIASAKGAASEIRLNDAKLWSDQTPELYELKAEIIENGRVIDEAEEKFGVRKIEWSAKTGLLCNGKELKLRGGCIHHDNGPLGACEFEESAYRRIRILKQAGYNAVRSAHNPISKALLRACDELGMYIMDETFDMWLTRKNDYDYSLYFKAEHEKDIRAMIDKDFNHPSVILYSVGNEIGDVGTVYGQNYHKSMVDLCHRLDPSRPVTNSVNIMAAMSKPKDKPEPVLKCSPKDVVDPRREVKASKATGSKLINNIVTFFPLILASIKPKAVKNNLRQIMDDEDIVGFNYGDHLMESLHEIDPDRLMLNTETFPKNIGKNWPVILRNSHMIGDFMWTGWDYLGEAGIGVVLYGREPKQFNKPYPCIAAGIGAIDLTGVMESQGYYAAVVWGAYTKPYIGVRPVNRSGEKTQMGQWRGTDVISSWSWNGYEGKQAEVHVFSRGAQAELQLNGVSLGRRNITEYTAKFTVPYEPGVLTAVSYDDKGQEIARSALKTAGTETKLTVKTEKKELIANGEDLAYIHVSVTDGEGIIKNLEEKRIQVKVDGDGTLQAVGSGNPVTEESYLDSSFTTYNGRMLIVVRSTLQAGTIRVTVRSDGAGRQEVILKTAEEKL